MGHRAISVLLREFAKDTSSGRTFTGRGRIVILTDDPSPLSGPVTVGEVSLPADSVEMQLSGGGLDLGDPWEGFTEAQIRAIRDRDWAFRAERQARQFKRAA